MTLDDSPARRTAARAGGGLLALVLALTMSACGSDGGDGSGGGSTRPAAAPGSSDSGSSDSGSSNSGSSEDTQAAACVKDSDYLSGTSTIVWTPDAKSEHQVAEVSADNRFALTAAGKLEPTTVEVAAGEVFSVTMAADSDGVSVLKIGCDGGQTMTKGTPAGIYITAPGTYAVTSGFGDDPAGTIVVK